MSAPYHCEPGFTDTVGEQFDSSPQPRLRGSARGFLTDDELAALRDGVNRGGCLGFMHDPPCRKGLFFAALAVGLFLYARNQRNRP